MTDDSNTKTNSTPVPSMSKMGAEYLELRDEVAQLMAKAEEERHDSSREEMEAAIGAVMDQMSSLTMKIASSPAGSPQELTHKARVALDWIDEDGDLPAVLVASVCADIIALFSSDR